MFESIGAESSAQRIRSAAAPPLAAFLFAQLYFLFYPLLPRVPALLFWLVVIVLGCGAIAGAVLLVRVARRERPRGAELGWLTGAIVIELICAWLAIEMTVPWLL